MLRVVVTLVPFGDESEARELGRLVIGKTGPPGTKHAKYRVRVDAGHVLPGLIRHERALGFWPLVAKAARKIARAKVRMA